MIIDVIFNWCFLTVFGLVGGGITFLITSLLGEWLYDKFDAFTLWEWSDSETGPVITAWIIACVFVGVIFALLMYELVI